MAPVLPPFLVAVDALCAMGIGFFVAILRAMFLTKNKYLHHIIDFLITFLALFLLQVHVAQNSYAGQVRLFMLISMIFGVFSAFFTVVPVIVYAVSLVHSMLCFVCAFIAEKYLKIIFFWLKHKIIELFKAFLCEKNKRNIKKHLKSSAVLLYNSTIDN